jgi:tetratricopeptide (TPR) repeat protein
MNSLLMVLIALTPMVCQADAMERRLKATLADATSQSQAGQHDAAVALARIALESATTRYGPEDQHVGAVLTVLSVVLENAGNAREALTTMESAVAILDKPKLSSDIEKAFIRLRLATLYLDASRGAEAVRLYQQAMPLVEKHTSTKDPLRALFWARLAAAHYEAHALPELNTALGHARNMLDNPKLKRDKQTLLAIKITADTYSRVEQYSEAAEMYARGLGLLERLRVQIPALKLRFLEGRGAALVLLYQFEEADRILADAVKLSQEIGAQSQITTAGLQVTLGNSFHLQGRYREAIAETLEGLKVLESAGALGTNGTLAAYSILTLSYSEAGLYPEAIDAGLKAKNICEKLCDPSDRRAENIAMSLGGAYFQLGQYDEALPLLQRALKSLELQNAPPSLHMALAKNNLAVTYLWLGQSEQA